MNTEGALRSISVSQILLMLRSGYVKRKGDKGHIPDKKNSIEEYFGLSKEQIDYLLTHSIIKSFKVVIPKQKPKVELPFNLVEDVTENEAKNWGKMSKAAKARMSQLANSGVTESNPTPEVPSTTSQVIVDNAIN